jgi:hypothetical protein
VLKLTSRFVLQVLPYLLMALAAVVLLPGVAELLIGAALPSAASFPSRGIETMIEPFDHGHTPRDLIRQAHETFAPNEFLREVAKVVDLEDR